eukprot:4903897-Pyramimonas_sp.AAC.1
MQGSSLVGGGIADRVPVQESVVEDIVPLLRAGVIVAVFPPSSGRCIPRVLFHAKMLQLTPMR